MNHLAAVKWIPMATILAGICANPASARNFRVNQYPNGTVLGCAACHVNPGGGGTRTAFGNRVFQIIGGSSGSVPFWSPALAAEDSDGDKFCNGQEVGDPDGDGTPVAGASVTNPGVATSKPANSRPVFTSIPVTRATMGLPYQYQAAATDTDACQALTFSKVAGPAWLSVSGSGLVTGTPPDGIGGDVAVTVQVADNGSPAETTNQNYTLSVMASFAGWQQLKFALPAEASLAQPGADPDADGVVNLIEYARRTNPRVADAAPSLWPAFDSAGRLQTTVALRDDDPKLTARMDVAGTIEFNPSNSISGGVTDPIPGDGFKTWTFVDTVSRTNTATRFGRLKIELLP